MPESEVIEEQLRRVRRRWTLVELQRVTYLTVATTAAGTALLLLLALVAGTRLFAVVAAALGATVVATVAVLAVDARRRWARAAGVAGWVDRRARLDGRLTTLVELAGTAPGSAGRRNACAARPPHGAPPFFMPLLIEENLGRLRSWRPERLVPRAVPLGALAAALASIGTLLLVVALAPGLRPRMPEIVYAEQPVEGVETDAADGVADRVVVAPAAPGARPDADGSGAASDGADTPRDDSALARLSAELQDRIRRDLWGPAWERMREAAARTARRDAERRRAHAPDAAVADADDEESSEMEEDARLAAEPGRRRQRLGDGRGRGFRRRDATPDERAADEHDGERADGAAPGADGVAAGAGNDTDPDLFGAPSAAGEGNGDTFELALSAPVHARRGGARRAGTGPAPPSGPDTRPELAAGQRDESAVRKLAVPAAYEAIVRQVFAHHQPPDARVRPAGAGASGGTPP